MDIKSLQENGTRGKMSGFFFFTELQKKKIVDYNKN